LGAIREDTSGTGSWSADTRGEAGKDSCIEEIVESTAGVCKPEKGITLADGSVKQDPHARGIGLGCVGGSATEMEVGSRNALVGELGGTESKRFLERDN
jgi:hypothetical protein